MASEIVIPVLDQTTSEARLLGWLKREGDPVRRGEVLCEIETEKATVEIEAPAAGILRRIFIEPGATVPPLTVVGLVGGADEDLPEVDPFYRTQPAPTAPAPQPAASAPASAPRKLAVSPRARRLADEHNLNLATVTGTGPGGRIQEEDVRQALEAQAAAAPARAGQATAQRVSQSWAAIPHFYTTLTVDMTHVVARQAALGAAYTYTDFMALGIGRAMQAAPVLNGWWRDGRHERPVEVHLGLVVQTERGLVIPTLAGLAERDLAAIAEERARLVAQAHAGKLSAAAMTAATFTLSNMGRGHIDHFTAIISPPQVAILSVGSVLPRPHVVAGELAVRPTAGITVGADHRAVDGRAAAAFLEALKTALENDV